MQVKDYQMECKQLRKYISSGKLRAEERREKKGPSEYSTQAEPLQHQQGVFLIWYLGISFNSIALNTLTLISVS